MATAANILDPRGVSDLDNVLARVRDLGPGIRELGRETELAGRVSAETMAALHDAGALVLTKPKKFGGLGLAPSSLVMLGHELDRYCGSAAWCASLANCNSWFAASWPEKAQQEIWGEDSTALLAGVAIPTGKAERVAGGFRVAGKFPFASNCDNSTWAFVSAAVTGEGDAPAEAGWFLLPIAELEIDHASWQVSGMQGTGSKTLSTTAPVFVPSHRALMFADVASGEVPGRADAANRVARFGYTTFGAAALVGPMLGMARGALDCFVEAIASKLRVTFKPGMAIPASASLFVQARIGAATATLDAALALLLSRLAEAEAWVDAGERLDDRDRVAVRGALGFAARQSVLVTNALAEAAGATAAGIDLPLQRAWRDVNAAGRHASLDPQALEALVGQQRLGLPLAGIY